MSWDFTEDAAFHALVDAFAESGESSAMEFLANGEGAFHFQDLTQNAAGEGEDLSDSSVLYPRSRNFFFGELAPQRAHLNKNAHLNRRRVFKCA